MSLTYYQKKYIDEIAAEVYGDGYEKIDDYNGYNVYQITFNKPVIMDPVVVFVDADGNIWSPVGEEYAKYREKVYGY